MPTFKGTPVEVEVAMDQPILLGVELYRKHAGVRSDDKDCY